MIVFIDDHRTMYGVEPICKVCTLFNSLKEPMLSFLSLFKLPIELIDLFLLFIFGRSHALA